MLAYLYLTLNVQKEQLYRITGRLLNDHTLVYYGEERKQGKHERFGSFVIRLNGQLLRKDKRAVAGRQLQLSGGFESSRWRGGFTVIIGTKP